MFGNRRICQVCNTPQVDDDFDGETDVCTVCSRVHKRKLANYDLMRDEGQPDINQFSARLKELQKHDPVITTVADHIREGLGGSEGYAQRAVEDFKTVRGEDLSADQKKLHTINQGALTKWHAIIIDLMKMRDSMVGDHDAMGEMEEEDLQAIVSQGALVRLDVDSQFRMEMFQAILRHEPDIANRMIDSLPPLIVEEPVYDPELETV